MRFLPAKSRPASEQGFRRCSAGNVPILAALILALLSLTTAASLETANLYVAKQQSQRVADLANLAAAATPDAIANGAASPVAVATAANIVALNGMSGAETVTSVVAAPQTESGQALATVVALTVPRLFRNAVGGTSSRVDGRSVADLRKSRSGACVASLGGPINIYANARVTGPTCSLSAKTFLYICGKAAVTAQAVSVGYSASAEAPYLCSTASYTPDASTFTYKAKPANSLATQPDIVAIRQRLDAMARWPYRTTSPYALMNPSVPKGTDRSYAVGEKASLPQDKPSGDLTIDGADLTFPGSGAADPTCAKPTTISGNIRLSGISTLTFGSGCYAIAGYVTGQAGARTTFAQAPGAQVTFVFKQYITNNGGAMTFPDATYSVWGSVSNLSTGTMSFGKGLKVFGAAITNQSGSLQFQDGSVHLNGGTITNGSGRLSFGTGDFNLWGGSISNAGTGTITYGDGPFLFYGGTIRNEKGTLIFGKGPFQFQGGSLTLLAGSTTRFGVGDLNFYGGTITMAGDSTTFGYGGSATTGAGSVFLYGGSLSLTTRNLTAVGVSFAFLGGTVSLLGVGDINATAPTAANPAYGYRNILFVLFGGAFNLYQSDNRVDTMSGLIYAATGNSSIYGNQTVNYPPGGCLQVVADVVDIYSNARIAVAPCLGVAVPAESANPVLVE
ncbi:pilus assembly protein TadG-related protein [Methylorubrum zatmanii]|uniref:Pilus assembly protein TadG-related protein n=1 Tax=Methylorubrum zatmanii TaxID=29429 RepID=A0ABW1WR82_9HYPH|nr:pilus assembly protein TadG-related protein [Methylorubrum zatmanii]MBD8909610.1 hypothetical protein [Methylorubrum zatmanii]